MSDETEDNIDEATYSYKAARAGKDIGKPSKQFAKIAKSAGEKYGSEERGKKVAGAILAKIRSKHGMKEEAELDECDMLDTSLSDVDASAKGEVYKKSSEKTTAPTKPTGTKTGVTSTGSGEAYNTTPGTKRMPAVEHAIRGIMERTYEVRKIRAEAAEISIGTPEQRQDWMNVEQGKMDVVDYFNKYRITGDE